MKFNKELPKDLQVKTILQNFDKEQGELLNKLNNKHNDYEKVVAERDELLQKNKELARQLKIYNGMRKYFNSQVSLIGTDK